MPHNYQIKTTVQFPEQTTIPKAQSENVLFDILVKNIGITQIYAKVISEELHNTVDKYVN